MSKDSQKEIDDLNKNLGRIFGRGSTENLINMRRNALTHQERPTLNVSSSIKMDPAPLNGKPPLFRLRKYAIVSNIMLMFIY